MEFVQGNLSREQSVAKAFTKDDSKFTHVFNCAGMTKYGQVHIECRTLNFLYTSSYWIRDVFERCWDRIAKRISNPDVAPF